MVSRSCECASQAEHDTGLNAFGGGQFRGPLEAFVGVINSAEGLRDDDRPTFQLSRRNLLTMNPLARDAERHWYDAWSLGRITSAQDQLCGDPRRRRLLL